MLMLCNTIYFIIFSNLRFGHLYSQAPRRLAGFKPASSMPCACMAARSRCSAPQWPGGSMKAVKVTDANGKIIRWPVAIDLGIIDGKRVRK
jgi:hypothetical protein